MNVGFNTAVPAFGSSKNRREAQVRAMGLPEASYNIKELMRIREERAAKVEAKYVGIPQETATKTTVQQKKDEIIKDIANKELGLDLSKEAKCDFLFGNATDISKNLKHLLNLDDAQTIIAAKLVADATSKEFSQIKSADVLDYENNLSKEKYEKWNSSLEEKSDLLVRKINGKFCGIQKENPSWNDIYKAEEKIDNEKAAAIFPNGRKGGQKLDYSC